MWPGGFEQGIQKESGLVDDSPLLELITDIHSKQTLKRKFNVASADANEGTFNPYDETTPNEHVPLAVVGSASIPLVFPHRVLDGKTLMDGGSIWGINV